HFRHRIYWPDESLRRRRSVSERRMRAHLVVVLTPILDHDLCLIERVEDFAVEQFVSQLSVEALAVAVLPGASRFDVGGLGANRGDPVPNSLSDELGPIVGSDMNRNAARDKE